MGRCRMTSREERALLAKLGGLSVALEILKGEATVTVHRGPEFRSVGSVHVSPGSTIELTTVSGRQLGITTPASRDTIFAGAIAAGLRPLRQGAFNELSVPWDYRIVHVGEVTSSNETDVPAVQRIELARCQVISEDINDTEHLFSPDDVWMFELPSKTAP